MKLNSLRFALVAAVTFLVVFLMNYIGNSQPDKLERALMMGAGGVAGLAGGMWFYNRNKHDDQPPHDFD